MSNSVKVLSEVDVDGVVGDVMVVKKMGRGCYKVDATAGFEIDKVELRLDCASTIVNKNEANAGFVFHQNCNVDGGSNCVVDRRTSVFLPSSPEALVHDAISRKMGVCRC